MAVNFPGPFVLRIFYSVPATFGLHRANFNVDVVLGATTPALTFAEYTVKRRGAADQGLSGATESLLAELDGFFNTNVTLGPVELWKVTVTDLGNNAFSVEETFWSSYAPTLNVGTNAAVTVLNSQSIITLRSNEGSIMRVDLLDTVIPSGAFDNAPFGNSLAQNLADFLTGPNGFVLCRDTSYPRTAKGFFPGINEALFKKRNRQT